MRKSMLSPSILYTCVSDVLNESFEQHTFMIGVSSIATVFDL